MPINFLCMESMKKFLRKHDVAVDLGTANTLIYIKDIGIVLNEPSILAIRTNNGRSTIVAVGHEAKEMLGRTPGSIITVRPMKDGVIADFEHCEKMLQYFLHRAITRTLLPKYVRVVVCVPSAATSVERRAIKESVINAGVSEVFLIEEPMAAAIGAGLPIEEASGSLVVDIGGGTTEVAVISLNGLVYKNSIKYAGDFADDQIIAYVRRKHNTIIGESTAEKIKIKLSDPIENSIEFTGRRIVDGLPQRIIMKSNELIEVLKDLFDNIIAEIRNCLECTPAELSADISEKGIMLTGGGAKLLNLTRVITEKTGIHSFIADASLDCVINGAGFSLALLDKPEAKEVFS
jgi:rod shape-determining protein MreB